MNSKPSRAKKVSILFMLLQAAFYASVFLVDGMFAQYLSVFGYGDSFIGIALMSSAIASMVTQPLFGYWCDRKLNYRAALLIAFTSLALTIPLFFRFGPQSRTVVMLFSIVTMSLFKAMYASLDSWISKLQREIPELDFGRVRSVGSLAYAVASAGLARVMALLGYSSAVWMYWSCFVVMTVSILLLPNPALIPEESQQVSLRDAARQLFRNRRFVVFIMCSLLAWLAGSSTMLFSSRFIASIGGSVTEIGIAFFVMAMAEVLVMLLYTKLTECFGSQLLLLVGMFGMAVKNLLLCMCPTPQWAIFAMISQGFSYAILIPGAVYYINEFIPKKYIASALLAYNALAMSLPQIIGSPIYGTLAEKYSVGIMIGLTGIPAVIAGIWFGIEMLSEKKNKSENE